MDDNGYKYGLTPKAARVQVLNECSRISAKDVERFGFTKEELINAGFRPHVGGDWRAES